MEENLLIKDLIEIESKNPITILDEFRKLNKNELNAYLTMFLNLNRVGTSLLGLSNSPQLNKYIARSILA